MTTRYRTFRGLHEASPCHGPGGRNGSNSPSGAAFGAGRVRGRDPLPHRNGVRDRERARVGDPDRDHSRALRDPVRVGDRVAPTSSATATATTTTSATPAPSTTSPEPSDTPEPEPSECQDSKVDVSISGLPGKIAAGSGWHKFSLNVLNNSKSTLNELGFFAGASSDKEGDDLFQSKKVQLQAYNEDTKAWEDVDSEGYAVGYVGYTDELKPDYEVDIRSVST